MKKIILSTILVLHALISNAQSNIDSGLIAHYPLDNNINDIGGNNLNGKFFDGTWVENRFGTPRTALYFDGINDYFSISKFGKFIPSSDFTISLWAKSIKNVTSNTLMLMSDDVSNRIALSLYYSHNGQGAFFWDYGNINSRVFIEPVSPNGGWEYFVVYYNSKLKKIGLYRNLQLLQEVDNNSKYQQDSTRSMNIGMGKDGYFNGTLDDIKFYNRLLDTTEMRIIFNSVPTIGVNELNSKSSMFSINPNPCNQKIILSVKPQLIGYDYYIFNSLGQVMLSDKISLVENTIDISEFSKDIYYLRIKGINRVQKIIKTQY